MKLIKKIGPSNLFVLVLTLLVIVVAEYLFLRGERLHGIFIGLWAPTILGIVIFIKQIKNGS